MSQPEELKEIEKLLTPFNIDYQVLDIEFDQKSLIQARSRTTVMYLDKTEYRSLQEIIADYVDLRSRIQSSNQGASNQEVSNQEVPNNQARTSTQNSSSNTQNSLNPSTEVPDLNTDTIAEGESEEILPDSGLMEKRSADLRHSWGILHREHKEVMGYNLTYITRGYGYRPPGDPSLLTAQLCTIPASASSNLFIDKASWQRIDESLLSLLDRLLRALEEYKAAFGLRGFDDQSPSDPQADQRLPIFLSEIQLLVSRISRSSGSVEDGQWVLNLSSLVYDLIRRLIQAKDLLLSGILTFGDSTCALGKSITLDCIQPDPSVQWERIHFFSIPEESVQLTFDNIVTNTVTPGECMTELGDYFIRLPFDCCQALVSPDPGSLSSCPSSPVTNVAGISALQNQWYQLIMVADSADSSGCIEDPLLTGDEVTTDCELKIQNQHSEVQTLVTNEGANSKILRIVRSYSTLASDSSDSADPLKESWNTRAVVIGMVSLGITLVFSLMVLMCRMIRRGTSKPSGPVPVPGPPVRPRRPPANRSASPESVRPSNRSHSPESPQIESFTPMPCPQQSQRSREDLSWHQLRRQVWTRLWTNSLQPSNTPLRITYGLAINDPSMVDPYYASEGQPFVARASQRGSPFR